MDRIIAVNSNTYHGYSLEEALEGIAAAGFHYVELTATKGWTEHVSYDMSFAQMLAVKNKLQELDLKAFALSGHCNLRDRNRCEDFVLNIQMAHFFGCRYVVSSIGEAHLEDGKSEEADLISNIRSFVPLLEELDMYLVLETHGDEGRGEDILAIVQEVESKRVGINYDTANVIFYGNVAPQNDIRTCIHEVQMFHLKDKRGGYRVWDFPALGKGEIDFGAVFKEVFKANNKAPFSIEIEFTSDGAKSLQEVNKAVADSYYYLKNKGFQI